MTNFLPFVKLCGAHYLYEMWEKMKEKFQEGKF